ncbi:MAG: methyltransferase domain-containing protein [Ferruginibacter sp.]
MPWNPQKYNQFKSIRYKPFYDLIELISESDLHKAVDIGCGTGEQTRILAEKFAKTSFTGIDSSKEMLADAESLKTERLNFELSTTEEFAVSQSKWDLLFSNAALQWSDDHEKLFPALIAHLNEGGQFAVQMPVQNENLLNKILLDLVKEKPFVDQLNGWRRESPVLSIDEYAAIMFEAGLKEIQIIQKVYPIIADDPDKLFNFISGSALIPYLEKLSAEQQKLFTEEYKIRIEKALKKFPAIYAFKRLLLYGRKQKV